jgi:penicillin amidase
MRVKDQVVVLDGTAGKVKIQRLPGGFPRIEADREIDLHYGLGYIHGHDRQMQMWLLKSIGRGRGSELIQASDDLIELDKFMRWIQLYRDEAQEVRKLSPEVLEIFKAYCQGVNAAVKDTGTPFEFRLVRLTPDRWSPEDIILMINMIGFIGLAQSQGDMEKFILQMLRNGISPQQIREMFPYIEDEITEEQIELIGKVKLTRPQIPESIKWLGKLPGLSASNNWAVRPEKTKSGSAILCGDPHLALQVPSIWYSALLISGSHYMMGATLPGIPSVVLGRAPRLSWAVTYAPMDMADYFIEDVRNKKYRRGNQRLSFKIREEVIRPKKKDPIYMRIYENDLGILEEEPTDDGYYLNFAWAGRRSRAAETANHLLQLPHAKSVEEALELFAGLTFAPFNWVCADADGNIGYQLGGLYPRKPAGTSGLLPYPAWDESMHWQEMTDPHEYPRVINPPEGYIVTANQDLNRFGRVKPIKLPMSSYRADRIAALIDSGNELTAADMKKMQYDRYSLQAEKFMEIIKPLLPDTENGQILKEWDRCYDGSSLGATLFEKIYYELILAVFGENGMGREVVAHMIAETSMFAMLHGNFDRVLLMAESAWFGEKSREEIYRAAIDKALAGRPEPYGRTRRIYINNLFFGGRLPRFLGFDYGPYEHIGSRATIPQSQIFEAMGRPTTIAASFRMITDMSTHEMHTNVPGGASDRRFSKYYTRGLREWNEGAYEVFKPW